MSPLRAPARLTLALFAACAHAPPPARRAAPTPPRVDAVVPAPAPAPDRRNAAPPEPPAPSLSLSLVAPTDPTRWRLVNHAAEPLRVLLDRATEHTPRACESPLERLGADGRYRCMPAHVEIDVPAFSAIAPGGALTITAGPTVRSGAHLPPLPAGRYRWTVRAARGATGQDDVAVARATFEVTGLGPDESRALAARVAAAEARGCVEAIEPAQRALAWTTSSAVALAALAAPGPADARSPLWLTVARLPEAHDALLAALRRRRDDELLAASTVLRYGGYFPEDLREAAHAGLVRGLARHAPVSPAALLAVAFTPWRSDLLYALAARAETAADDGDLAALASSLACPPPDVDGEGLGELARALRERAARARDRDLARGLRARAAALERLLLAQRRAIDAQLRVARGRQRLLRGHLAPVTGCGFAFPRGAPADPACPSLRIPESDPLLRFLREPMAVRRVTHDADVCAAED